MTFEAIQLAGHEIAPATRAEIRVPTVEAPHGEWIDLVATVFHGGRPGPRVLIGAGVHGDETPAVASVARLISRIDPPSVAGTLILLPVQNPIGFRDQSRLPYGLVLHSPFDQLPYDIATGYPGNPDGNSTAVMTHVLWHTFIHDVDYFIDLHTPAVGGAYVPHAILPSAVDSNLKEEGLRLARAFGCQYVQEAHDPPGGRFAHSVLAEMGKLGLVFEYGEGARNDRETVEFGADGLENLLHALDTIAGTVFERPELQRLQAMTYVRSRRGGLLRTIRMLGDELTTGEVIAEIVHPTGEVVEQVRAPHSGPLARLTTLPVVWTGDQIASVGKRM